jgi:hypothetical protein
MAIDDPRSDEQMALLQQQIRNIDMQRRRERAQMGGAIAGRAAYRQGGATFAQLQQVAPLPGGFMPSEMAKYNKPLLDAYNELTAAQAAVGAGEEEQMKQRVIFHKAAMAEGVKMLNKKRDLANDIEKKKIDAQIKQAQEHIDVLDNMEGVTGTKGGITEYDRGRAAAGSVISRTAKDGGKIDKGVITGKVAGLRSREAIDSFKENLREQYATTYGKGMDSKFDSGAEYGDVMAHIDQTADKLEAEGKLKPATGGEDSGLSGEGMMLGVGGADERRAVLVHMRQGIDNLNAATGGQLDKEMAQIASGSTGGRTTDIMEAADLTVTRGLTSPEDKKQYMTDLNEQKASVIDNLLRPGAGPESRKMMMAMAESPAFQEKKKQLGLMTDEALFRHLRTAYRSTAREGRMKDRMTLAALKQGRKPATGPQASAMNALAAAVETKMAPKRPGASAINISDPMTVTETTEEIA